MVKFEKARIECVCTLTQKLKLRTISTNLSRNAFLLAQGLRDDWQPQLPSTEQASQAIALYNQVGREIALDRLREPVNYAN